MHKLLTCAIHRDILAENLKRKGSISGCSKHSYSNLADVGISSAVKSQVHGVQN